MAADCHHEDDELPKLVKNIAISWSKSQIVIRRMKQPPVLAVRIDIWRDKNKHDWFADLSICRGLFTITNMLRDGDSVCGLEWCQKSWVFALFLQIFSGLKSFYVTKLTPHGKDTSKNRFMQIFTLFAPRCLTRRQWRTDSMCWSDGIRSLPGSRKIEIPCQNINYSITIGS